MCLWDWELGRKSDLRNDALCNGLSDGIQLRDVTTTPHSNSDVNVGKLLGTDDEDGFVGFVSDEGTATVSAFQVEGV